MKDTRKAADFWVSLLVIAISIIFFVQASDMPKSDRGIGPGDYPKIICIVLFVLGMIQLVTTVVKCKGIPLIDFKTVQGRYLFRAAIMLAMTIAYYMLVKKVGFVLLTPFYLFGSFMLFGYKRKILAAIIAVVFSVVIYILFVRVFMVILPRGILG